MTDGVIFKPIIKSIGWQYVCAHSRQEIARLRTIHLYFSVTFAHTTFPIYLYNLLRLHTLPFQYTCIIYYVCAHLQFYTSSEQYFLHLYLYDLYRIGEYYLINIIHSKIQFWFGNMEKIIINRRKPGILCDGFQYRIHREAK